MYRYEIESFNLRTQSKSAHETWFEDDLIPDEGRGQQLWAHARPGRPAVMWVQHEDDEQREALHIVGFGTDPVTLADMVGSHIKWVRV